MKPVRVRFAPSPTGLLHIGGVRTCLFNWAFARHHQGKLILRIEDTDLERSTQASVDAIIDSLKWIGLDWDEGPFFQTQRFARYKEVLMQLLQAGHAYFCYTTKEALAQLRSEQESRGEIPRYDGKWRPEYGKVLPSIPDGVKPVIRFKMPTEGETVWQDAVKGQISFKNSQLDDLVIARADFSPTYNFCVVVDDIDMAISHVIRGDDHVNNTPKQINMFKAIFAAYGLDEELPVFAHLPMILNEKGEKLSKRRDAVCVADYAAQGILPETLLNYLARLSWGHGDMEIFSMRQLSEKFNLEDCSPSPGRLNKDKLLWLNHYYLQLSDKQRIIDLLADFMDPTIVIKSHRDYLAILSLHLPRVNELVSLAKNISYFYKKNSVEPADIVLLTEQAKGYLQLFHDQIEQSDWSVDDINDITRKICKDLSIKMVELCKPARIAICGVSSTADFSTTLFYVGKEEVMRRIKSVL